MTAADRGSPDIPVTHPKVASLLPEWRTFRGVSLLLRPFGTGAPGGNVDDARHLFAALADFLTPTERVRLRLAGYCPLPPETFHVTWADLVHDGNLSKLDRSARLPFTNGKQVDAGHEYPRELREIVNESGIGDLAHESFRFTVAEVAMRSASALTIELAACPDAANVRLDRARATLARLLAARFGLVLGLFRPHVTLGYFADRTAAVSARVIVDELDQKLTRLSEIGEVSFRGPTPFIFSSMADFRES